MTNLPRLPSELPYWKDHPFSPEDAWRFDLGVLSFGHWYDSRENETEWKPSDQNSRPEGFTLQSKYSSVSEILTLYGRKEQKKQEELFDQTELAEIFELIDESEW